MFTKTLAVIAATALVGANAASPDVVGSTCSCTPLANTTSIIADVSKMFLPASCNFKGVEGTTYACAFGPAGAKESASIQAICRYDLYGNLICIWE